MKTSELTGAALDWAVAKCEEAFTHYQDYRVVDGHLQAMFCDVWLSAYYEPSTDWERGGPIIEREKITLVCAPCYDTYWVAEKGRLDVDCMTGPTPLIAAMRCYVASKLGDDVEIPEGLK